MIGAENETRKHAVHNFVLFEPAFESGSSDKTVFNNRVGLKPRPNHFSNDLNGWPLCLFAQNNFNLFKKTFFAQLSELIEVEVLGNKVHYDLFGL